MRSCVAQTLLPASVNSALRSKDVRPWSLRKPIMLACDGRFFHQFHLSKQIANCYRFFFLQSDLMQLILWSAISTGHD